MLRIISGEFRGRTIAAPPGKIARPTTDRVRESLFSALVSARGGFQGSRVLDAFAGSGALGFEALSRGAAYAFFCEKDARVFRVLNENARALPLGAGRADIRLGDAFSLLLHDIPCPFDVVFLDPPYAFSPQEVLAFVSRMAHARALNAGALVSYEHAREANEAVDGAAANARNLALARRKNYGDTVLDIFRVDIDIY